MKRLTSRNMPKYHWKCIFYRTYSQPVAKSIMAASRNKERKAVLSKLITLGVGLHDVFPDSFSSQVGAVLCDVMSAGRGRLIEGRTAWHRFLPLISHYLESFLIIYCNRWVEKIKMLFLKPLFCKEKPSSGRNSTSKVRVWPWWRYIFPHSRCRCRCRKVKKDGFCRELAQAYTCR